LLFKNKHHLMDSSNKDNAKMEVKPKRELNLDEEMPQLEIYESNPEELDTQYNSSFVGVSKCANSSVWRARCSYDKDANYCGTFTTELDAAHAVNERCVEVGIPLKNPDLLKKNSKMNFKENSKISSLIELPLEKSIKIEKMIMCNSNDDEANKIEDDEDSSSTTSNDDDVDYCGLESLLLSLDPKKNEIFK